MSSTLSSWPLRSSTSISRKISGTSKNLLKVKNPSHLLKEHTISSNVDNGIDSIATRNFKTHILTFSSCLYGLFIFVLGSSLPLSQSTSKKTFKPYFEDFFYIYLFSFGIIYYVYAYFFIYNECQENFSDSEFLRRRKTERYSERNSEIESSTKCFIRTRSYSLSDGAVGNSFLKIGVLVFGVASVLYTALKLVTLLTPSRDLDKFDIIEVVTKSLEMAFTFIQIYFIFFKSKICIQRRKVLSEFALMHMIACNLCICFSSIVYRIFQDQNSRQAGPKNLEKDLSFNASSLFQASRLFFNENSMNKERKDNDQHSVQSLLMTSRDYLYPCVIQYAAICANLCYAVWKRIGKRIYAKRSKNKDREIISNHVASDNINKGLFFGLALLILSLISLSLLLASSATSQKSPFGAVSYTICQSSQILILILSLMALIGAFIRFHSLHYTTYKMAALISSATSHVSSPNFRETEEEEENEMSMKRINFASSLENKLMFLGSVAEYFYAVLSAISAFHTLTNQSLLIIMNASVTLIQTTIQNIFMYTGLHRCSITPEHFIDKPGRQFVTFIIFCNTSLCFFNLCAPEKSTAEGAIQPSFYGKMCWSILSHVLTPFIVFYRFHSITCLAQIWKKTYRSR